ncbi:hypothetical protein EZV62_027428 [Acer yangbiense]|uniref:Uncharacterized protein n=1 Tax=Acer yangbiense TaxID=1000413 RepID=A0A5C7GTM6_9ROSI|nr:hypothetical protein EZV62_027428 [Acer yangbiense]
MQEADELAKVLVKVPMWVSRMRQQTSRILFRLCPLPFMEETELSCIQKHVHVLGLMTYVDVLQKAQILAKKDEITINTKLKEKVHGPPQKKQWNKNFQCKSDYRNRGQKRYRDDDAETKELPLYETCGKKHGGICFRKFGFTSSVGFLLQAHKYLRKGCVGYLASVMYTKKSGVEL